jgi:hypothetical protein
MLPFANLSFCRQRPRRLRKLRVRLTMLGLPLRLVRRWPPLRQRRVIGWCGRELRFMSAWNRRASSPLKPAHGVRNDCWSWRADGQKPGSARLRRKVRVAH